MVAESDKENPFSHETAEQKRSPSLHFDLIEPSISPKKIWFWAAVLFSILGVWFIYEATFTDFSERWLPFTKETAQLLVPEAPDRQEPIELLELTHTVTEDQIRIEGKIKNRTAQPIDDLMATIALSFVASLNSVVKDIDVIPARIEPGFEALFQLEQPINEKPAGYVVDFKLANGAIVRHKDSRKITVY